MIPVDPRLKLLSYSSRALLQSCPRKYQLRKLNSQESLIDDPDRDITLAFGTVVGLGIQLTLAKVSPSALYLELLDAWNLPLNAEHSKAKKSFYLALVAIEKFSTLYNEFGLFSDLEILEYNGKPAYELSYAIDFGAGYYERGFIDIILKDKNTGEIFIIEVKTDGSRSPPNSAKYANSSQALGYSLILDYMNLSYASYKVIYLVYLTELMDFMVMPFTKGALAKAEWLLSTKLDIAAIEAYAAAGLFPKHGQSCISYNRVCGYFDICNLETRYVTPKITPEAVAAEITADLAKYDIRVSLAELIDTQLARPQEPSNEDTK